MKWCSGIPDLGERHETVVIAVGKPARIGVDLRKK